MVGSARERGARHVLFAHVHSHGSFRQRYFLTHSPRKCPSPPLLVSKIRLGVIDVYIRARVLGVEEVRDYVGVWRLFHTARTFHPVRAFHVPPAHRRCYRCQLALHGCWVFCSATRTCGGNAQLTRVSENMLCSELEVFMGPCECSCGVCSLFVTHQKLVKTAGGCTF